MRKLNILLLFPILVTSCKVHTALNKMSQEKATYEIWSNGTQKTVCFIPMVHAGKPAFYEDLREKILNLKDQGYVVFYESIRKSQIPHSVLTPEIIALYTSCPIIRTRNRDTLANLVYLLKLKRMVGVIPDPASYALMLKSSIIFRKAVIQPSVKYVGDSSSNFNIDVSLQELVDFYEQKNGPISLAQIEFATPLNEPLPGSRKLKSKDTRIAVIDYRDEYLAREIHESTFPKILVLYGLDHLKGVLGSLRQLDGTWTVLDH